MTAIFLIENQYIDILEGVLHVTYVLLRSFVMIFCWLAGFRLQGNVSNVLRC